MTAKDILIGLGNPAMSDDAIGLVVSSEVGKRVSDFDVEASSAGGFDVVDLILGRRRAVIIDSMVTGRYEPGTVVRIESGRDVETSRTGRSHGINFIEAVELARSCGAALPCEIIVYGIEVEDPFSVGERISPSVLAGVDRIVSSIIEDLEESR
jgi:hydrogenase maturation protease